MPFGKRTDAAGLTIDFDAVYREIIAAALDASGLEPLRADAELMDDIVLTPMLERLLLSEYAVADLTMAKAPTLYALGARHAVRPRGAVSIFAEGGRLPFDVRSLQALPYRLTPAGMPRDVAITRAALIECFKEFLTTATHSSIYPLVEDYRDIDHTKTDVFRERVRYSSELKVLLAQARQTGIAAVRALEQKLDDMRTVEAGVVIDLFLSYRAVQGWRDMIALVPKMSRPLASTVMVQEQLALALNRVGEGEQAEQILMALLEKRGPSSETYGILGRIYKDRWEAARRSGADGAAQVWLDKAIGAYLRGFETDWRDAYPGINAVTLMELKDPPDPRCVHLIPIVIYAVERRMATGDPDYWDYATLLELAILAKDEQKAMVALRHALACVRESWEPDTTARNLRLISEVRERRQEEMPWAKQIEERLTCASDTRLKTARQRS
jgi:hypothetical protein